MANRADKRKFHYIYKITRFDGKYYIGMHSTDDLQDRYFGSGKKITRSIKKYGKEFHSKEILEFLPSRAALKLREKELVNEELLADVKCMNLTIGGLGGGGNNWKYAHTDEAKIKRSATRKTRGTDQGENNNSWGTCWITHPVQGNKRIHKDELDTFLSNGWITGRVMPDGFGRAQGDALRGKTLLEIVGQDRIEEVLKNRTRKISTSVPSQAKV